MPRLKSLTIDAAQGNFFSHLERLRMPALEHLVIPGNAILRQAVPLFEQISATVHTLTLADTLPPAHVDHLKHLHGIQILVFDDPNCAGEPDFSYAVNDGFFAAVSRDVWPKLTAVCLFSCGTFALGEGSGTLSFINSRTQELPVSGAEGSPCRLREFEVKTTVPEWFRAEAKRLLET